MDHDPHPLLELIRRRVSHERFDTSRDVPDDLIRELVSDAIQAPSSFNIQHWRFIAVRSPEGKRRLQEAAYGQEQVGQSAVTFIVLGDLRGVEKLPEIMDQAVNAGALPRGKADGWVRMSRQIYADGQTARDEAIRSATLAAMLLMLSAEARGLAAGALTGFDPQRVTREFTIHDPLLPVMLVAVGYPSGAAVERKPRLDVDRVLAFERGRCF